MNTIRLTNISPGGPGQPDSYSIDIPSGKKFVPVRIDNGINGQQTFLSLCASWILSGEHPMDDGTKTLKIIKTAADYSIYYPPYAPPPKTNVLYDPAYPLPAGTHNIGIAGSTAVNLEGFLIDE